jgi:NADPH:quinone reductase-like Zn-dependent oxidoreductase
LTLPEIKATGSIEFEQGRLVGQDEERARIVNDDAAMERTKSFITKGFASGRLKPLIARVFRLDQIQEATRFLESNAQVGKIVVNF